MYNILFFDGECRYCNLWVQWVVDRDKDRCFRFASLQSDFAKEMFKYYHIAKDLDTILVLKNKPSGQQVIMFKSEAVFFILSILKSKSFLYRLIKLMPRLISNFGYDCIAAVRRYIPITDCRVYSDEEKRLFLDDNDFTEWLFRFSHKL